MNKTKITIDTTVAAPTKKVWEYWTLPKHIVNWNFASEDWHCPRSENDLRVGGKMNSRMEAKDGSFGFDFEAIYDEVIDQKKITYSMADGRQATTLFEDQGDKTKITTTFDAEGTNSIEMQKGGWQAILDNFKNYTEGLKKMKKFMAVYRGEPNKGNAEWDKLSEDERQQRIQHGMQVWGQWMQENAAQIVYPGGPLGKTLQVNKEGISSKVNNDCGFVIIEASSHEEAAKKFLNHPHFSIFPGENVEVMECLPIPGRGE